MSDQEIFISLIQGPISVPIKAGLEDRISPVIFPIEGQNLILGFSSPLKLAQFFENSMEYVEMTPEMLFSHCQRGDLALGFDLGQDYGRIFSADDLGVIARKSRHGDFISWAGDANWQEAKADPVLAEALSAFLRDHELETVLYHLTSQKGEIVLAIDKAIFAQNIGAWFELEKTVARFAKADIINLWPVAFKDAAFDEIKKHGAKISAAPRETLQSPPILR